MPKKRKTRHKWLLFNDGAEGRKCLKCELVQYEYGTTDKKKRWWHPEAPDGITVCPGAWIITREDPSWPDPRYGVCTHDDFCTSYPELTAGEVE